MVSHKPHSVPGRSGAGRHWFEPRLQGGFTLVETLLGTVMISVVAAAALWTLNVMNVYAAKGRLFSQAMARAEQEIDAILTAGPFDLSASAPKYPVIYTDPVTNVTSTLQPGTTITIPNASQPTAVLVYTDPVTNQQIVTGTMTITTTNTNTMGVVGSTSTDLNIVKANVRIGWTFRGQPYFVSLDTMRTGVQ